MPPPHVVPSPPWPQPGPTGQVLPKRPGRSWGTILGGLAVVVAVGATLTVAAVSLANPSDDEATGPTTTLDEDVLPNAALPLGEGAEEGEATDSGNETGSASGGPVDQGWDPQVADLVTFVEQTRGLAFDHPVEIEFLPPDEFTEAARADLAPGEPERAALEAQLAPFRALGLLDENVDVVAAEADLAGLSTAAYYIAGAEGERIVVRGDELTQNVRASIVHELTHALHAQHFGVPPGEPATEAEVARLAVEEGDAMRMQSEWVNTLSSEDFEAYRQEATEDYAAYAAALDAIPPIVDALDSGPYVMGPQLVDVLAADRGNEGVDEALESPPVSTEQLLDPQAYLDGEAPVAVGEPVVPAAATERSAPFSMGAYQLYLALSSRIDPIDALDAVDGWGGDSTVTYTRGPRACIATAIRGDSAADDAEIKAALDAWVAAGPPDGGRVAAGPGGATTLRSCESAPEADAAAIATDPSDALVVLDSRAIFTWQAMELEGASMDDALAESGCLVRTLPRETLATVLQTADPPAAVQDQLEAAKADCTGG